MFAATGAAIIRTEIIRGGTIAMGLAREFDGVGGYLPHGRGGLVLRRDVARCGAS
jgi:hypothetical protein